MGNKGRERRGKEDGEKGMEKMEKGENTKGGRQGGRGNEDQKEGQRRRGGNGKEEMETRGICQVLQRHEHWDVGRDLEKSR